MSTRIYIGGLPTDISPTDVENLFQKVEGDCCRYFVQHGFWMAALPSTTCFRWGVLLPCNSFCTKHSAAWSSKIDPFVWVMQFGDIRTLDLKATARPPAFAFIGKQYASCLQKCVTSPNFLTLEAGILSLLARNWARQLLSFDSPDDLRLYTT